MMYRFAILFFMIHLLLQADREQEITLRIIEKVVFGISREAVTPVWAGSPELQTIILDSRSLKEEPDCTKATLLLIDKQSVIPKNCESKKRFATDYQTLKKHPDALGAFFWQKGRPNIIFLRNNLEKNTITLPRELHKYIENEI